MDTDAGAGEARERYQAGLEEVVSRVRNDTGVADLPVFVSLLPRQGTLELSVGNLMLMIPPNRVFCTQISGLMEKESRFC